MRRRGSRACAAAAVAAAALALAGGCGKKAPLRLPEQRPTEKAAALRVLVRERRAIVSFRVPSRRVFPEREDPWVLARVLRKVGPAAEFTEAAAILEPKGFEFGAPLSWTDEGRDAGVPVTYRIEFHDGRRRRRAVSMPVTVSWSSVPAAPGGMRAVGTPGSVTLSWEPPAGAPAGLGYRVYRRESGAAEPAPLGAEPSQAPGYVDTRVEAAKEYCYRVRAVAAGPSLEVEGPPGEERCARTEDATPPPVPSGLRVTAVGGALLLTWDPVAAADLAGYRVYRAVGEGGFERLTDAPVPGAAFRDELRGVPAGARCRWAVTTVDASPRRNESAFSAAAEAAAP